MSDQKPTVVLVHGAFAESASWNGVIAALYAEGVTSVAVANPLRSLAGDAAYVRDRDRGDALGVERGDDPVPAGGLGESAVHEHDGRLLI